jgi:hypothetical protein
MKRKEVLPIIYTSSWELIIDQTKVFLKTSLKVLKPRYNFTDTNI